MAYKILRCESCPTEVAIDAKTKEKPIACPKCRGMLIQDRTGEDFSGTKYDCPGCDNSFTLKQTPFKCAFCDHTFAARSYGYF
jgi:DNA-directed RNA polymerase subunit RPC12/RpoP